MQFIKQYKWLLPLMGFTGMLLLCRILYTRSLTFSFVPWNQFLAIVPLYLSYNIHKQNKTIVKWNLFLLWLLFFPNAMYIVTDMFHLREREDIPQWYDLLILFSAALNGVIIGMASLHDIELFLLQTIKTKWVAPLIFMLFFLCGYGIYLGRYLRWNSWDIFLRPLMILHDVKQDIRHPFHYNQSWMVSILFATWLYLLYRYFRKIPEKHTI